MTAVYQTADRKIPEHVAVIMDGNGRWAEKQGHMRLFGHRNGVKAVRRAVSFAAKIGIKQLTLFAFSSENWRRPASEVSGLMELFALALSNEVKLLKKNNVRFITIGNLSRFSKSLQKAIFLVEKETKDCTGLLLTVAVNYGGRWDILEAAKRLARDAERGIIDLDKATEQDFSERLALPQDVDLLIRTGGEHRISNFLLWQLAYSEIFITDALWPDFDDEIFESAVEYYAGRERRFGCTSEQIRNEQESL